MVTALLVLLAIDLPKAAIVVETERLPKSVHPDRAFILWMDNPVKHNGVLQVYTCPDVTRGSHSYTGPTRVSLVDTRSGAIINTVEIKEQWTESEVDSFDVPIKIRRGPYSVPATLKGHEGRPKIMTLRDHNGDGVAAEFAFFDAQNCTITNTSLVGYSISQDRVVWYPVRIREWTDGAAHHWLDDLLTTKPVAPGHWVYRKTYNGDPGYETVYDVRYDPAHEEFVGTVTQKKLN